MTACSLLPSDVIFLACNNRVHILRKEDNPQECANCTQSYVLWEGDYYRFAGVRLVPGDGGLASFQNVQEVHRVQRP